MSSETITVEIWRGKEEGEFQTYQVPRMESQTVLDIVTYVQRNLDPGLSYRFACRVGPPRFARPCFSRAWRSRSLRNSKTRPHAVSIACGS